MFKQLWHYRLRPPLASSQAAAVSPECSNSPKSPNLDVAEQFLLSPTLLRSHYYPQAFYRATTVHTYSHTTKYFPRSHNHKVPHSLEYNVYVSSPVSKQIVNTLSSLVQHRRRDLNALSSVLSQTLCHHSALWLVHSLILFGLAQNK